MKDAYKAVILKSGILAPNTCHSKIYCPKIALCATPGQFVHIRCSGSFAPLLRRPFSIASADGKEGTIDIIFKVVGEGTLILSNKEPDDVVDVIGPLGKGFPMPYPGINPLLIGGGIGTAPLLFLAKKLAQAMLPHDIDMGKSTGLAVLGFSNAEAVFGADFLKSCGFHVMVTTDDGSFGIKGNPADYLSSYFETSCFETQSYKKSGWQIYACGPIPLLSRIKDISDAYKVPAYVSLEERMACGIGACLGCAVKSPGKGYKKVCSDGPVFDSREVVFS
ncbi:MAG: dihydroorotate dehydrogenase electron transfer subunit [Tepidanaerobacteraceae bacterium]